MEYIFGFIIESNKYGVNRMQLAMVDVNTILQDNKLKLYGIKHIPISTLDNLVCYTFLTMRNGNYSKWKYIRYICYPT